MGFLDLTLPESPDNSGEESRDAKTRPARRVSATAPSSRRAAPRASPHRARKDGQTREATMERAEGSAMQKTDPKNISFTGYIPDPPADEFPDLSDSNSGLTTAKSESWTENRMKDCSSSSPSTVSNLSRTGDATARPKKYG